MASISIAIQSVSVSVSLSELQKLGPEKEDRMNAPSNEYSAVCWLFCWADKAQEGGIVNTSGVGALVHR